MNALHTSLSAAEIAGLLMALWILVCVPFYAFAALWLYRRRKALRRVIENVLAFFRELERRGA